MNYMKRLLIAAALSAAIALSQVVTVSALVRPPEASLERGTTDVLDLNFRPEPRRISPFPGLGNRTFRPKHDVYRFDSHFASAKEQRRALLGPVSRLAPRLQPGDPVFQLNVSLTYSNDGSPVPEFWLAAFDGAEFFPGHGIHGLGQIILPASNRTVKEIHVSENGASTRYQLFTVNLLISGNNTVIRLAFSTVWWRGRIVDPNGKPAAGVGISATTCPQAQFPDAMGGCLENYQADWYTDQNGFFALRVSPGVYQQVWLVPPTEDSGFLFTSLPPKAILRDVNDTYTIRTGVSLSFSVGFKNGTTDIQTNDGFIASGVVVADWLVAPWGPVDSLEGIYYFQHYGLEPFHLTVAPGTYNIYVAEHFSEVNRRVAWHLPVFKDGTKVNLRIPKVPLDVHLVNAVSHQYVNDCCITLYTVSCASPFSDSSYYGETELSSRSSGHFTWYVDPGKYKMVAGTCDEESSPRKWKKTKSEVFVAQGVAPVNVTLLLQPDPEKVFHLSGFVLFPDKAPLRDTMITATLPDNRSWTTGIGYDTSQGNWQPREPGQFIMMLPKGGPYTLTTRISPNNRLYPYGGVYWGGDRVLAKNVYIRHNTTLRLTIPAYRWKVRFVDSRGKICNCTGLIDGPVVLRDNVSTFDLSRLRALVLNGETTIWAPPGNYYNLSFDLDNGNKAHLNLPIASRVITRNLNQTVVIPATVNLSGRVLFYDGSPANRSITLFYTSSKGIGAYSSVITNETGHYSMPVVKGSSINIFAQLGSLCDSISLLKNVMISTDTVKHFTIKAASWIGTVVDSKGKPRGGVTFSAQGECGSTSTPYLETTTDAEGRFTFPFVIPATYSVTLVRTVNGASGHILTVKLPKQIVGTTNISKTYTMADDAGTEKLAFGAVAGTVRFRDGTLILVGHIEWGQRGLLGKIGSGGRFWGRIPVGTNVPISLYFETDAVSFSGAATQNVTVVAGRTTTRNFFLDFATWKGLVLDKRGKPMAGATVTAWRAMSDEFNDFYASHEGVQVHMVTGANGRFQGKVPKGRYTDVRVFPPGEFDLPLVVGVNETIQKNVDRTYTFQS